MHWCMWKRDWAVLLFNGVAERQDLIWTGCKSPCVLCGELQSSLSTGSDSGRASAMLEKETTRLTKSWIQNVLTEQSPQDICLLAQLADLSGVSALKCPLFSPSPNCSLFYATWNYIFYVQLWLLQGDRTVASFPPTEALQYLHLRSLLVVSEIVQAHLHKSSNGASVLSVHH